MSSAMMRVYRYSENRVFKISAYPNYVQAQKRFVLNTLIQDHKRKLEILAMESMLDTNVDLMSTLSKDAESIDIQLPSDQATINHLKFGFAGTKLYGLLQKISLTVKLDGLKSIFDYAVLSDIEEEAVCTHKKSMINKREFSLRHDDSYAMAARTHHLSFSMNDPSMGGGHVRHASLSHSNTSGRLFADHTTGHASDRILQDFERGYDDDYDATYGDHFGEHLSAQSFESGRRFQNRPAALVSIKLDEEEEKAKIGSSSSARVSPSTKRTGVFQFGSLHNSPLARRQSIREVIPEEDKFVLTERYTKESLDDDDDEGQRISTLMGGDESGSYLHRLTQNRETGNRMISDYLLGPQFSPREKLKQIESKKGPVSRLAATGFVSPANRGAGTRVKKGASTSSGIGSSTGARRKFSKH
eukprot:CAMPEP_0115019004 /NCGR_PEP_ID=MMETSP0216-20121206/29170_1 /TAXON_ID=223996 /ORGANISM="Protocruzia adherens, Strain Boccale" /LENGTH=414 /DNA_ID=CAMNT_0002390361 /DNA_START=291 /DNA_END=1536 /DNA_ORIENTATION=+